MPRFRRVHHPAYQNPPPLCRDPKLRRTAQAMLLEVRRTVTRQPAGQPRLSEARPGFNDQKSSERGTRDTQSSCSRKSAHFGAIPNGLPMNHIYGIGRLSGRDMSRVPRSIAGDPYTQASLRSAWASPPVGGYRSFGPSSGLVGRPTFALTNGEKNKSPNH
jgi:hypothetical protein